MVQNMSKIVESALELVGETPLLKLSGFAEKVGAVNANIYGKLEYLNPTGSVKDRAALAMIKDVEEKGILKEAIAKAEKLRDEIEGAVILGQFTNAANPAIHKRTTGPEIWEQIGGKVDIFVAGVGTGGTITGVGEYLKEQNSAVQIVAVEPAKRPENQGKNIVVLLPDSGDRYLSTALFA